MHRMSFVSENSLFRVDLNRERTKVLALDDEIDSSLPSATIFARSCRRDNCLALRRPAISNSPSIDCVGDYSRNFIRREIIKLKFQKNTFKFLHDVVDRSLHVDLVRPFTIRYRHSRHSADLPSQSLLRHRNPDRHGRAYGAFHLR